MRHQVIEKDWGSERIIVNTDAYCMKRITVFKNVWSSGGRFHWHPIKDETFYIIEGELMLNLEGQILKLRRGYSVRVKPGMKHKFTALSGVAMFIEASTHDDPEDTVREV